MISIKTTFRKMDGIVSVFSTLLIIFSIMLLFDFKDPMAIVFSSIAVILVIAAVTTVITWIEISQLKAEKFSGQSSQVAQNFYNALVRTLKQGKDDRTKYDAVILFGEALLRPLYLGGCFNYFIKIGNVIIDAAVKSDNNKAQAKTYIELGWINIIHGDNSAAEENINKGIEIAKQNNFLMIEAKGHRHLLALYGYTSECAIPENIKNYEKEHNILNELIDKMPEGPEKAAFVGGVIYGEAEYQFCLRNYDEALRLCDNADDLRQKIGDNSRAIRNYAQRGKIELFRGNYPEAQSNFNQGYDAAVNEDRVDEIIKNAYGKACYWLLQKNPDQAAKILSQIKEYGDVKLPPNDQLIIDKFFYSKRR